MSAEGLVVGLIEAVDAVPGKKLSRCTINIGADAPVCIVTNAVVEVGKRVVVAPVGSTVGGEVVKKANVGGVWSEGMLCDAPMVWGKGSANIPATVPDELDPGAPPPAERPRGGHAGAAAEPAATQVEPLFEKKVKLGKEEKKAAAEAKKAELAAKKAARKAAEDAGGSEGGPAAEADEEAIAEVAYATEGLSLDESGVS